MSCCLVAQPCPTLCDPMDCSPLGSSVHEISQARILEWVATSFSSGSSWPRGWNCISWQADSLLLSHLGSPAAHDTPRFFVRWACWRSLFFPEHDRPYLPLLGHFFIQQTLAKNALWGHKSHSEPQEAIGWRGRRQTQNPRRALQCHRLTDGQTCAQGSGWPPWRSSWRGR